MAKVKLGKYLTEYSEKNKNNLPIPVYSVTNSSGFCTDYFNKDVSSESKHSYKIVPFGYFAYNPSRINVGSIACQECDEKVIVSPLYTIFSCSNEIENKYLLYFLKSEYGSRMINSSVSGSVRFNLKFKTLCDFEITERTIDEQKEAIKLFDLINELIENCDDKIVMLEELIKTLFNSMFINKGYEYKSMKEISTGNGEYGAGSAAVDYTPSRPRYVRITDINDDGTLNEDAVCSVNLNDDDEFLLRYGDFMFARMGATVGKAYAYTSGYEIFAGYLIRFKLKLEIMNPKFLFWFTKTDEYLKWVEANQSGAAQPGINAKKYTSLMVLCPPLELQNKFVEIAEKIELTKCKIKGKKKKYQELLNKKMDDYFN